MREARATNELSTWSEQEIREVEDSVFAWETSLSPKVRLMFAFSDDEVGNLHSREHATCIALAAHAFLCAHSIQQETDRKKALQFLTEDFLINWNHVKVEELIGMHIYISPLN